MLRHVRSVYHQSRHMSGWCCTQLPRSVIKVSGQDSTSFLQGLMTNDIEKLASSEQRSMFCMFLNSLLTIHQTTPPLSTSAPSYPTLTSATPILESLLWVQDSCWKTQRMLTIILLETLNMLTRSSIIITGVSWVLRRAGLSMVWAR